MTNEKKTSTNEQHLTATNQTKLNTTPKHTITLPGLHNRLRNPKAVIATDPLTRPNRLALMVDISGSMWGDKIESLKTAVTGFINACDFSNTALALEPFGDKAATNRVSLTTQQLMLMTTVQMLEATGGTPMAEAMDYSINTYSITRGVIVSDGRPDSENSVYNLANNYKSAEIPIDTVHIGDSTEGEEVLKRIAEITHGQYLKFTDIQAFSKSFKYLTPGYYAMLTSGAVSAEQLGATKILHSSAEQKDK